MPLGILDIWEAVVILPRGLQWRVHRIERKIKKERLLLMAVDECHGFSAKGIGQVLLLIDRFIAAPDRVEAIGPCVHVGMGAAEESEELIEPTLLWLISGLVS